MPNLHPITLDELIRKGFPQVKDLSYKFTTYSLNSPFSFKFESLSHFIVFLKEHQNMDEPERLLLENFFKELHLPTQTFFYVNFFDEKDTLGF